MNKSMSKLYNATFFMSSFTIAQFQQKAKLIENFMLRSCQEINLTSLAKYPEVILGIAGEAHT